MAFLRVSQAARIANVAASTIRRYCDAGELRHVRLPSGERRVPAEELDHLFQDHERRPPVPCDTAAGIRLAPGFMPSAGEFQSRD